MSLTLLIGIIFLCLLSEGFFTGTELAVIHADKLKLRSRAEKGSKGAKLALKYQSKPGWFFSATLLGTNLSLVTASVCTTFYIVSRFGKEYEGWAVLLTPIMLVFGEIIPKSLYQHYANRLVYKIVYPIKLFGGVFFPVVYLLTMLNDLFIQKMTKQTREEPPVTRDELEHLIDERTMDETTSPHHTIISKIFDLADKRVSNIMTPLVEVEALPLATTMKEIETLFDQSTHSRLPVYEGRITNIVGVLHTIDQLMSDKQARLSQLMRPAYYVPEDMPVDDLLVTMKRKGEPLAVVVDEYGGASGIITLEDVVEEIVGDIQDEYDKQTPLYFRIGKNRYLVNGRLEMIEANEKLKLDLPTGDYETMAGFLIHLIGRIPKNGESFRYGDLQFTVHLATERAIQEIEVKVK